jgi:hypothetical protein
MSSTANDSFLPIIERLRRIKFQSKFPPGNKNLYEKISVVREVAQSEIYFQITFKPVCRSDLQTRHVILTRSTPALFSSADSSGILRWKILSSSWLSPQEYITRLDAENDPAPDCTGRLRFPFCSTTSTKNHAYTFSVFDKSRFFQLQGTCGAQCLSRWKIDQKYHVSRRYVFFLTAYRIRADSK